MELRDLLKRIDENKKEIDRRKPLSPEEAKQLDAYYRVGTTYTSNALEGNSLTLTETKVLLEDGITIGGKPIRDCYEATGHAQAFDFMLEAARGEPFAVSEDTVLRLHKLFYNRIDSEKAGVYRSERVLITGTEHLPSLPGEVPARMQAFISELNDKWETTHPVALSAYAHKGLVDIHPFVDGNRRTARLLMNLIVVSHGYQLISISPILRVDYINALEAGRHGGGIKKEAFDRFIAEREVEAQKDYCRMFQITMPKKGDVSRGRLS